MPIRKNLNSKNVSRLSELTLAIRGLANCQNPVTHPEEGIVVNNGVRICTRSSDSHMHVRNMTVFQEGDKGVDRSPCGTGTCAQLAALYGKGKVETKRDYVHGRVLGRTFRDKVASVTKVATLDTIIPEVTGSAYTVGMSNLILPPNDRMTDKLLIE